MRERNQSMSLPPDLVVGAILLTVYSAVSYSVSSGQAARSSRACRGRCGGSARAPVFAWLTFAPRRSAAARELATAMAMPNRLTKLFGMDELLDRICAARRRGQPIQGQRALLLGERRPGNTGNKPGSARPLRRTRHTAFVLMMLPRVLTSTAHNSGPPFERKRYCDREAMARLFLRST